MKTIYSLYPEQTIGVMGFNFLFLSVQLKHMVDDCSESVNVGLLQV